MATRRRSNGAKGRPKRAARAGAPTKKRGTKGSTTSKTPVKKAATKKAAQTPVRKKARSRRARMTSSDAGLTRAEQAIMARMAALSPDDPRYQVLEAALAFKASWVILGDHLSEVHQKRTFKQWGHPTFARYVTDEIRITPATARKMVRSFRWLGDEAPELIPKFEDGRVRPERDVPDFNTIGVLADARRAYESDQVAEDAYLALKRAALGGDRSAAELRRELKAALPEKDPASTDPVRALRRALTHSVKVIEQLRAWDGSDALLVEAERLRDEIAHHLPRTGAAGGAPAVVHSSP